MKLKSMTLTRLAAGAASLVLLGVGASFVAAGCGSSDGDAADGGGGTSTTGQPPARPEGNATTDTSVRTFAVDTLKLGTNNEWKKIGYNIDGKVSTGASKDVCAPVPGGPTSPHQDGDNGIDNSFGANVLPILLPLQQDLPRLASNALANGSFTIMIQTNGLPSAAPTDSTGLSGQLFAGGQFSDIGDGGLGAPPAFDLTTDWPVLPAILKGSDVASGSKIQFANAYVSGGTFVSGDRLTVSLNLNFSGVQLDLSVRNAIITMKPNGASMTDGIISGYLDTKEISAAITKIGGRLSTQFCGGTAITSFVQNLEYSSDMLADGTTDGSRQCDAISIGLGFTAKEVKNPTKVAPAGGDTPDPCLDPDAGN